MSTTHNDISIQARASTTTLPSEIWRWSAVDISAQVRAGSVSCAEVLQAFYQRIDSVNPRLNAIVHADRMGALETANRADDLLRSAPHKVEILHGVPLTIKLNVDVAGEATTNGVPAHAGGIAPAESAVVTGLRNAGANIIGRARNSPSSSSCNRSQTPASCQSRKRRQQVTPEPQPISTCKSRQRSPGCNTNKIPLNAARSGTGFRPGYSSRRGFGCGSKGSIRFHNSSSMIGLSIPLTSLSRRPRLTACP